ncbi:uncharacterized protein [Physcomitrium patens]|uniref:Uncharacterized protein n=1 Tax=Physcomitrium patens TaxID=3218 RepID=A0A2K1KI98_PHYPA|nr:uncharacterized protein LOC112282485 [Physcomitrium patens]PNR53498.1 hypothetical protein PHYPA_007173 [Physcomitrium patens]|eukprot:XP_024375878.1 uncharacterized protein LOC112282485 [Physcomitrella patens]
MARLSWPVLGGVLFCDILAFILAVAAMSKRSKAAPTYAEPGYLTCGYTKDTSTGLAATAFVFLLFAQVFVTIVTGCSCCGKTNSKQGCGRICAILLLVSSWITFTIAEIFLLTGAVVNNIRTEGQIDVGVTTQDEAHCAQTKKAIFAVGAVFTFFAMVFNIAYYVVQVSSENKDQQWNSYRADEGYSAHEGGGIGMTGFERL